MKIFELLDTQYNRYVQSVKNYLSNTLSNYDESYGNSTIFGQIINVLSATVQNIMLYIEDAFTEQNKYTAQRKKSIYGLAALSGYQPSLGKATGVQLKINFTPSNTQDLNVVVNNKEQLICTQNGLQYNIILPQEAIVMSIEKDNSTRYIYAVQGQFESQTFIADGGRYYTQNFKYQGNLDTDYLEVRVNDVLYEQVSSVYDMDPDGLQYTYKVNYISGVDIIFGNNVHGRALNEGDVIKITYLVHDGEQGNLDISKETYFVFNNNLIDISGTSINGNNIFNVTFATNDAVTSGSNSETTTNVRNMIGLNSRSLVMSSADNYKNFLNKFSFCGYNRTWSEPGSLIINSLIIRNYKLLLDSGKDYFSMTENDYKLTDAQKESLINAVNKNGAQMAGVTYNIIDPEICKYAMYVYIKLKKNSHDREYVNQQIRNSIANFFSNVQSDIYIPKSDIINLIKNEIDLIDGVNVYFLSEKNETALQTKEYTKVTQTYNPSTNTFDKKTEHIYLYDGENPNLGLDDHGNIYLESDEQFPVLMGGWDYLNKEGQEVKIVDPLIIVFE